MMGKAKTQQRLIDNLEDEFAKVLSLPLYVFSVCALIFSSDFHLFIACVAFQVQREFHLPPGFSECGAL